MQTPAHPAHKDEIRSMRQLSFRGFQNMVGINPIDLDVGCSHDIHLVPASVSRWSGQDFNTIQ